MDRRCRRCCCTLVVCAALLATTLPRRSVQSFAGGVPSAVRRSRACSAATAQLGFQEAGRETFSERSLPHDEAPAPLAPLSDFEEAVLGGFDKDRMQSYFSSKPLELISRLIEVFGATWSAYQTWQAEELLPLEDRSRGKALVRSIESLGPAFVKAGQTLAQRPDIVGDEAAEAMKALQTSARPFPNSVAYRIIAEDLRHRGPIAPGVCPEGCDPTAAPLFAACSADPVASASLGQVYKATTHDGVEVAVKVQRPGVARQLGLDWVSMNFAIAVYRLFIPGPNDFGALVDAAVKGMLLEVDYHHEAANSEEFAARHSFLGFVTVPKWLPELTGPVGSARVLTTEWISGRKISDLPVAVGRQAVQMAVQACVVQLLLTGCVHADPHEGNLLYTDDGQLAFLDFGLMDTVAPNIRAGFADGIQGVVASDWRRVTESMQAVGFISDPVQKAKDPKARDPVYV
ncbi:unnamed protein product, partial [Polarella glacialis]